ncbi:MAG TPA: PEP-CTERM sorting domain-containing protein [Terrimicrobiaceae bacterium]
MSTHFLLKSILITVSVFSVVRNACADSFYVEGINDNGLVDPNWISDPMKEATFLYKPSSSYELAKVEFFTLSGKGDFTIRVRESFNGVPGDILGESTSQLSSSGFQGSEFSLPFSVVAGEDYWVGFYSQFETGSHFATAGNLITEYADLNLDGVWDVGPLTWLRPMMKFYAPVPEPSAGLLIGVGGMALLVGRTKRAI